MAGRQSSVLIESDGPDDAPNMQDAVTIDLMPPSAPRQDNSQQSRQSGGGDEIEIVDVDSLQPVDISQSRTAPQQGRDASLSEQDQGDGSYLDTQRAQSRGEDKPSRRQREKLHRDRNKQEIESLRLQNEELIRWRDSVEPRLSTIDQNRVRDTIANLDRAISDQTTVFQNAERQIVDAMTLIAQGDEGAKQTLLAAMRARDSAVINGQQFQNQKRQLVAVSQRAPADTNGQQQPQQQRQVQQPQQLAPVVQARVMDFADDHPWYDPNGNDDDSRAVLRIDREVAADGFNPEGRDYWREIEDRMRDELPHRYETKTQPRQNGNGAQAQQRQEQPAPQRRGPMTGGAADRGPTTPGKSQVFLDPERKNALILAGALDRDGRTVANKEKFARIVKGYQSYDRENGIGVRQ